MEVRIRKYRLKTDRADVIVPAADIILDIAHRVHAEAIWDPTIGIGDGLVPA